jgi:hypothetical protein
MEIHSAYWGIGGNYFDVTSRIKQDVDNGKLIHDYTRFDLGDPCKGIEKELTITYCDKGKIITKVYSEKTSSTLSVLIP